MEVLGGIGYCEESELPRLYREMPVNSIWEGSGNIMCLDVMRVLSKQPAAMELLRGVCGGERTEPPSRPRMASAAAAAETPAESRERDCPAAIVSARGRRCCATLRRRWRRPGAG
jgi:putative acyl-CoA dehydrogenase